MDKVGRGLHVCGQTKCVSVVPRGTTRLIFHLRFSIIHWQVDKSLSLLWERCTSYMMSKTTSAGSFLLPAWESHPSPTLTLMGWTQNDRWQEPEEAHLCVCDSFRGMIMDHKYPSIHAFICTCVCTVCVRSGASICFDFDGCKGGYITI